MDIRTSHRVQRLVTHGGRIVGVEATPDGRTQRFLARKAVIFASGGFTHDVELRENLLAFAVLGGCAVLANEGDFVAISSAKWRSPIAQQTKQIPNEHLEDEPGHLARAVLETFVIKPPKSLFG